MESINTPSAHEANVNPSLLQPLVTPHTQPPDQQNSSTTLDNPVEQEQPSLNTQLPQGKINQALGEVELKPHDSDAKLTQQNQSGQTIIETNIPPPPPPPPLPAKAIPPTEPAPVDVVQQQVAGLPGNEMPQPLPPDNLFADILNPAPQEITFSNANVDDMCEIARRSILNLGLSLINNGTDTDFAQQYNDKINTFRQNLTQILNDLSTILNQIDNQQLKDELVTKVKNAVKSGNASIGHINGLSQTQQDLQNGLEALTIFLYSRRRYETSIWEVATKAIATSMNCKDFPLPKNMESLGDMSPEQKLTFLSNVQDTLRSLEKRMGSVHSRQRHVTVDAGFHTRFATLFTDPGEANALKVTKEALRQQKPLINLLNKQIAVIAQSTLREKIETAQREALKKVHAKAGSHTLQLSLTLGAEAKILGLIDSSLGGAVKLSIATNVTVSEPYGNIMVGRQITFGGNLKAGFGFHLVPKVKDDTEGDNASGDLVGASATVTGELNVSRTKHRIYNTVDDVIKGEANSITMQLFAKKSLFHRHKPFQIGQNAHIANSLFVEQLKSRRIFSDFETLQSRYAANKAVTGKRTMTKAKLDATLTGAASVSMVSAKLGAGLTATPITKQKISMFTHILDKYAREMNPQVGLAPNVVAQLFQDIKFTTLQASTLNPLVLNAQNLQAAQADTLKAAIGELHDKYMDFIKQAAIVDQKGTMFHDSKRQCNMAKDNMAQTMKQLGVKSREEYLEQICKTHILLLDQLKKTQPGAMPQAQITKIENDYKNPAIKMSRDRMEKHLYDATVTKAKSVSTGASLNFNVSVAGNSIGVTGSYNATTTWGFPQSYRNQAKREVTLRFNGPVALPVVIECLEKVQDRLLEQNRSQINDIRQGQEPMLPDEAKSFAHSIWQVCKEYSKESAATLPTVGIALGTKQLGIDKLFSIGTSRSNAVEITFSWLKGNDGNYHFASMTTAAEKTTAGSIGGVAPILIAPVTLGLSANLQLAQVKRNVTSEYYTPHTFDTILTKRLWQLNDLWDNFAVQNVDMFRTVFSSIQTCGVLDQQVVDVAHDAFNLPRLPEDSSLVNNELRIYYNKLLELARTTQDNQLKATATQILRNIKNTVNAIVQMKNGQEQHPTPEQITANLDAQDNAVIIDTMNTLANLLIKADMIVMKAQQQQ